MSDLVYEYSPAPQNNAEYEAAIERMLRDMARMNEQMRQDQEAIERLRAESALLKAETRSLLASMGKPV